MFFDDDGLDYFDGVGMEDMVKSSNPPDYNGQPRNPDGTFGSGKQDDSDNVAVVPSTINRPLPGAGDTRPWKKPVRV